MTELDELRAQIDETDREILALFVRRQQIVDKIAEYKRRYSLPVYDAARESEKLRDAGLCPDDMSADAAALLAKLMELGRARQEAIDAAEDR